MFIYVHSRRPFPLQHSSILVYIHIFMWYVCLCVWYVCLCVWYVCLCAWYVCLCAWYTRHAQVSKCTRRCPSAGCLTSMPGWTTQPPTYTNHIHQQHTPTAYHVCRRAACEQPAGGAWHGWRTEACCTCVQRMHQLAHATARRHRTDRTTRSRHN